MSENRKKYIAYASIGFLLLFSSACRSARFLEADQALVVDAEIEGLPTELEEEAEDFIQPGIRPNSRLNLFLYNVANVSNGRYRTRKLRKIGEPPRIVDSALVELSTLQINRYLVNKGYLDARVQNEIRYDGKRASVLFRTDPGLPARVNTVSLRIEDPSVAALYLQNKHTFSSLRPGTRLDIDSIASEREHIYLLMRRNGYFDYVRQFMYVDVDTSLGPGKVNLRINIDNPENDAGHTRYRVDSNFVVIRHDDPARNRENPRLSTLPNGVSVADYTGKFRAEPVTRYLYQGGGSLYNIDLENLSYDRLYALNSFKSVKLSYRKTDDNRLNSHYELVPRPYMSNQIEGEYTFSAGMSGFNLGNTFSHRNLFGGSERLDLSLQYGVLFDSRIPGGLFNRVFNNNFQVGLNVSLPFLLTPFGQRESGRGGLPGTLFSSNLQVFDQASTYSNRYFVNTVAYHWYQGQHIQHHLSPLVLEYRHGQLNTDFAQDLIEQGYLLYVRSNNRAYFGLGSQYVYTRNGPKLNTLADFTYFRGSLDLSGNILDLAGQLFSFDENVDGEKEVFGVPYLQYAKAEGDVRFYRHFGGDRQLVVRLNPGIAVPYGNNSSLLIFEKSFFGGGMNGIRAWQARTLGPGNYNREDLDPALRMNFRNLDQLGEIKLEGNVEYRFRILNDLWGARVKGATFTDVGNIWRIDESELNPGGKFEAGKFLGQLAIGAGAGLRFDLDYFIIRLDVGAKVRDPQFEGSRQWVIKKWFNGGRAFKAEYATSNAPDRYRFLQYNFGLGMPF